MPRPRKRRKVCRLPDINRFGPLEISFDHKDYISMTVDEYETIRLIDLEGFTQEECAEQMKIARTTVQGIYIEARRKIADSLVIHRYATWYRRCSTYGISIHCCRWDYSSNISAGACIYDCI